MCSPVIWNFKIYSIKNLLPGRGSFEKPYKHCSTKCGSLKYPGSVPFPRRCLNGKSLPLKNNRSENTQSENGWEVPFWTGAARGTVSDITVDGRLIFPVFALPSAHGTVLPLKWSTRPGWSWRQTRRSVIWQTQAQPSSHAGNVSKNIILRSTCIMKRSQGFGKMSIQVYIQGTGGQGFCSQALGNMFYSWTSGILNFTNFWFFYGILHSHVNYVSIHVH